MRRANKNFRAKTRSELIEFLGGECVSCGFKDHRALQIDHINGGGAKEHKFIQNSISRLKSLVFERGPAYYQLLCANCNWIKRHEKNEYGSKDIENEEFSMELFDHGK